MKTCAIILAAGTGKRMGSKIPKQYMELSGKPVIYYTIKAFEESDVDEIILVTGFDEIEFCKKDIVKKYGFEKVINIVAGGKERYNSVYNGLLCADCDYVLIHDGARPFVSKEIITDAISEVDKYNACIVAVKAKDTIKVGDDNKNVVSTPNRKYLWQVQTPQVFKYKMIKEAYDYVINNTTDNITDDAMVWEVYHNEPVKLIEGEYSNIKITTPEDLAVGEVLLNYKKAYRSVDEEKKD